MLGILFGTACLVGLVAMLRGGPRRPWGFHGRFGGFGPPFGPRAAIDAVLERLEASPAQERVILAAVDEIRDAAWKARGELRETRGDVAKAVRAPSFDEARMGEAYARQDRAIEEVRKAFVSALTKVHEALDERQRVILADLVENATFFDLVRPRFSRDRYRGPWGHGCHGHHHDHGWNRGCC